MGVITYIGGEFPVFLTFRKYTSAIQDCIKLGMITEEDSIDCEFADFPDVQRKVNRAIIKCLSDLQKSNHDFFIKYYYTPFCANDEAKDNLCRLLDAGSHFQSNIFGRHFPRFGFIPCERSSIDIRFPYGKRYWFVRLGLRGKIITQVMIDTDHLDYFAGRLDCFHVVFNSGMELELDHGNLIVKERLNIWDRVDQFIDQL